LDLSGNLFGDTGGISLGESCLNNINLTCLDIRHNRLGNDTLIAFGKSLSKNNILLTLRLHTIDSESSVTSDGLMELCKGLSNSKVLSLQEDFSTILNAKESIERRKEFLRLLSLTSLIHIPLQTTLYLNFEEEDKKQQILWECSRCHYQNSDDRESCCICSEYNKEKKKRKKKEKFPSQKKERKTYSSNYKYFTKKF